MVSRTFQSLRKIFGWENQPKNKVIRRWRIVDCGDTGVFVFIDPKKEKIMLYGLTESEKSDNMELYGSVSASVEGRGFAPGQSILFPEGTV